QLQAWAIFPNHYHFVALSDAPKNLPVVIRKLHSITSHVVNKMDGCAGRKVWFQYWDTRLTNQRSYFCPAPLRTRERCTPWSRHRSGELPLVLGRVVRARRGAGISKNGFSLSLRPHICA
ncbi:MAG: hypothetical protein KGL02_14775, partial [Acidobacteriota bacterium]|nr:hypothetical protein [Acidobacteriota bacterium]